MSQQTAREVFNQEMDDYMSARRSGLSIDRKSFKFEIFKKQTKEDSEFVDFDKKEEKITEIEEEIKEIDEEVHDAEIVEESLEEKRESLLKRLFAKMRRQKKDVEEEMEEFQDVTPKIDDDLKEVLKITFKWIEKLPAYKLREFKNSEDFQKYKETLIKYELVREKN